MKLTAWELRDLLKEARDKHDRAEITLDELYSAADAYIAALKEYRTRTKKRFRLPSRTYIIRAV